MSKYIALNHLPTLQRPRERLLHDGVTSLDPASLLALILGTGQGQKEDAYQMAQRLLHECGGIIGLSQCHLNTLITLDGIGVVKAGRLLAAFELSRRIYGQSSIPTKKYVNYRNKLARIARDLWVEDSTMLIAYPAPILQEAHTLLIDQTIDVDFNMSTHLRTLLLKQHELIHHPIPFQSWMIFFLKASERPHQHEVQWMKKLQQHAQLLEISIETVMMVSESQDWIISSTHEQLQQEIWNG